MASVLRDDEFLVGLQDKACVREIPLFDSIE